MIIVYFLLVSAYVLLFLALLNQKNFDASISLFLLSVILFFIVMVCFLLNALFSG